MGKIFDRLYEFTQSVLKTMRYNGMYIAVSLILPYFLLSSNVGRDMVLYLADETTHHVGDYVIQAANIQLTMLSFIMLTFSIWIIPTWSINIWNRLIWGKAHSRHIEIFNKMVEIYNNAENGISVKYIALLPWFLFILSCFNSFYKGNALLLCYVVLIVCILLWQKTKDLIAEKMRQIVMKLYDKYQHLNEKKKGYAAAFFVLLSFIVLFLFAGVFVCLINSFNSIDLNRVAIIGFNLFFIFLVATYFYFVEKKLPPVHEETAYRFTAFIYGSLLITNAVMVLLLTFSNRESFIISINKLSPVFVIIILITFILFIADLFFTSQKTITDIQIEKKGVDLKVGKLYNSMWQLVAFILIIIIFFSSNNTHNIRKITVDEKWYRDPEKRKTLTSQFEAWYHRHNIDSLSDDTLNVFLISGQGGGSRAAAWFYINMKNLDRHDPDFYNNVFSISTVSGSSSGAGMYLADRFYGFRADTSVTISRLKTMYARNYFSSIFYGILLGDGLEGVISLSNEYPKDRNYFLQLEETKAYYEAINDSTGSSLVKDPFVKNDTANGKIQTDRFFNYDYLWAYMDTVKNKDSFFPLFFINSSVIDNGARAIFSPVKLDGFSFAKDLYKAFKNCTPCAVGSGYLNIPMTTAICQSQSFPIINANNYIDCVGRLVDGGIYDNTGCTTTFEVYYALKRFCNVNKQYKVRFIVVNLINYAIGHEFYAKFSRASILNTPTAAYKSLLGGHDTYAFNFLNKYAKDNGDSVINLIYKGEMPTTKILGNSDIDSLVAASCNEIKDECPSRLRIDLLKRGTIKRGINAAVYCKPYQ